MGELPDTLPIFLWPEVPLNLETLMIILPYSVGLAIVGLLESLMMYARREPGLQRLLIKAWFYCTPLKKHLHQ